MLQHPMYFQSCDLENHSVLSREHGRYVWPCSQRKPLVGEVPIIIVSIDCAAMFGRKHPCDSRGSNATLSERITLVLLLDDRVHLCCNLTHSASITIMRKA